MEILLLHREREIIRTKVKNINPYHEEPYARKRHVRFCEGYMEQSVFLLDILGTKVPIFCGKIVV